MGQTVGSPSVSPETQHEESYGYQVMIVEEITKTKLGLLITKYCGNEGTTDNEQTASIRKLLQRAITNLEPQREQYPGVWRDAELKIFDLYGNGYVVRSGQGSVKFVAQITGNGGVDLSKSKDESWWTSMKALVTRQNAPQLQIEGPPPDQSNASQGWLSSLKSRFSSGSQPKESQAEGLSPSGNDHELRPSEFQSQTDPGSASAGGDGTPHEQYQGQSLSGHGQGNGSQNNASSSFNPNSPQPVDNLPGSESQTGGDESGSVSQVQIQSTDQKKEGGPCSCYIA